MSVFVIGVIGAIASGKTFVAECFQRLGAERIDADAIGHEVLEQDDVKQRLIARWGMNILDHRGRIDRGQVAQRVFGASDAARGELKFLEQITHPHIARRIEQALAEHPDQRRTVVLDAAVMLKARWDRYCNKLVFVEAPCWLRWQRARQRGWHRQQFAARDAALRASYAGRSRADVIIDNSGTPGETFEQIKAFWYSPSLR